MKPVTVTPEDLFRPQRRYVIPLFQRGYVWNEVDHWGPLWRDIVVQTRRVQDADEKGGSSSALQHHFLGAIVLEPKLTRIRHVADQAVIDGQQRLTTLQLFLLAFRDVVGSNADADLTRDLAALTHNEGKWAQEEEKFKLWPTNIGRSAWRLVVEARTIEEIHDRFPLRREKVKRKTRYVRQPLAEAYLYFRAQIDAYLHGGPGIVETEDEERAPSVASSSDEADDAPLDTNRARYLFEALTKYFTVVAIELEGADDPQVIFETLNARMAPLTPTDLIRNFVFIAGTRRGVDTEALYASTWEAFDHDPGTAPDVPGFWRGWQKQGRRVLPRIDLFVFHYVTMRTGREIALNRLYQAFRRWWEEGDADRDGKVKLASSEDRDPEFELARMVNVANGMRIFLEPGDAPDPVARFARRLKVLDTTTPYPLLLYLAEHREEMGAKDYLGALTDLESYLIRRLLCQLTTKNYNQVMLRALGALRASDPPKRSALQNYLLSLEGEASRWPTDQELTKGVIVTPAYQSLGSGRTQMVLQALELAHYTGKEEGVVVPWLSVEHILPQTPASLEDWPYPSRQPSPSLEEVQSRFYFRESLGNLTLVVQPLNSSLSNGPFVTKKAKLAEESQLRMNRYFANFPKDHWMEADIAERSVALAALASRIWPRPSAQ